MSQEQTGSADATGRRTRRPVADGGRSEPASSPGATPDRSGANRLSPRPGSASRAVPGPAAVEAFDSIDDPGVPLPIVSNMKPKPPEPDPDLRPTTAEAPLVASPEDGRAGAAGRVEAGGDAKLPRLVTSNSGLVADGLGKRFKKRPVLRGVSVSVQRGEAVGLLGPNGAGKTTCFYIITGLIKADGGAVYLDGEDITDLPMYRRARLGIGYLPQEPSIFRGMSVENNIRAVLEVIEGDREKRETMLDDLLAEFSITHLRKTPAVALSGGERRRVEIARALASQPHFILLDEPLAGIDPIAVGDIRHLVSHLKNRGIGVLITDHNVRETLDIVDRAYIIHEGVVMMEGPPSEIVAHEDVRRVYLGDTFRL